MRDANRLFHIVRRDIHMGYSPYIGATERRYEDVVFFKFVHDVAYMVFRFGNVDNDDIRFDRIGIYGEAFYLSQTCS